MAGPWYVSSVNGNDGNSGLSKALAKATVDGASGLFSTAFAAGEELRVDKAHDETWAASHTLAWPGTVDLPNIILSIDWTSDVYERATTRQLYVTGTTNDLIFTGSLYTYGMYFEAFDRIQFSQIGHVWRNEDGTFKAGTFRVGNDDCVIRWLDVEYIVTVGNSAFNIFQAVNLEWHNGPNNRSKITDGGWSTPNELINSGIGYVWIRIVGVDLTAWPTAGELVSLGGQGSLDAEFVNCSIAASATIVDAVTSTTSPGARAKLLNCDDSTGNDLHRTEAYDRWGSTVVTDADYNNAGASDGANNISWKIVSNANAIEFVDPHNSLWISGWIDSIGTKTFTIETNSENVTFEDDELWMELEFLDASGDTQSSMLSDRMANPDSTPVAQTDTTDNPTWTTPNITTEKKQKLEVTATVRRKGPFRARVCLAKPSATVWIDPLVKVS